MSLVVLGCLFTLGVVAHNVEEAMLLPAWSATAGRWHPVVGHNEFRFAVTLLSLALILIGVSALFAGPQSVAAYLFAGYVFAMVTNALVPHILGTLILRRYLPGTGTAILFNLPLGTWFLYQSVAEEFVKWRTFVWAAPVVAVVILASIPVLFAMGRWLIPERSEIEQRAT